MRDHWFIYQGRLLVGQDIYWELGQVHGHDRHTWVVDDLELGRRPAEEYSHASWIGDAGRTVVYQFMMIEVDHWMASPEGVAALAVAHEEIRRRAGSAPSGRPATPPC